MSLDGKLAGAAEEIQKLERRILSLGDDITVEDDVNNIVVKTK
jgi:hypothetical protein